MTLQRLSRLLAPHGLRTHVPTPGDDKLSPCRGGVRRQTRIFEAVGKGNHQAWRQLHTHARQGLPPPFFEWPLFARGIAAREYTLKYTMAFFVDATFKYFTLPREFFQWRGICLVALIIEETSGWHSVCFRRARWLRSYMVVSRCISTTMAWVHGRLAYTAVMVYMMGLRWRIPA